MNFAQIEKKSVKIQIFPHIPKPDSTPSCTYTHSIRGIQYGCQWPQEVCHFRVEYSKLYCGTVLLQYW